MRTLEFISLVAASGHYRTSLKEVRGPKPPYSYELRIILTQDFDFDLYITITTV